MDAETIITELEPVLQRAHEEGLWFFHSSLSMGQLWMSPTELRALHQEGKFIWSAENWELRPPIQHIERMDADIRALKTKRYEFYKRVQEYDNERERPRVWIK